MKKLFVILILSSVLNAEEATLTDCTSTLSACQEYVSELESQTRDLQTTISDRTKERDEAVSQLGKETPPLLPWFAYVGLGFVAGGLATAVALR